jgi:VWFA-related protein
VLRHLTALGLVVASVAPAGAQPIVIGARAEIVYVDVLVTDRQGRPVPGLSREDFELRDDGRPVAIEVFQSPVVEVARPGAGIAGPDAPPSEAPPSQVAERPLVVVYVDSPNLTPGGRKRVLESLGPLLTSGLRAGAFRVLAMADDGGARTLTTITDDPEEVASALAAAGRPIAGGGALPAEERQVLEAVKTLVETEETGRGGTCVDAWPEVQALLRSHAESRGRRLQATADRLAQVASIVGSLPGSKALLYITEGLEQNPGLHLFQQYADICPTVAQWVSSEIQSPRQENDASAVLRALAARANAGRLTVYPLDASGLAVSALADPSREDRRYVPSARTEFVRLENLRGPLELIAADTGGRAIVNANDVGSALSSLTGDLTQRYTLGFVPGRDPDGRSHSIGVSLLRRKGLALRHRASYLQAATGTREGQRALAALLLGLEQDDLGASVLTELPEGGAEAILRIRVPLSRLAASAEAGGRSVRVRIVLATRPPGKEQPAVREQLFALPLPEAPSEPDPAASHEFVIRLPRPEGRPLEIGVGVLDALSAAATYRRVRLDPPPKTD